MGPFEDALERALATNEAKPARERLILIRIFEDLRALGYEGGYDLGLEKGQVENQVGVMRERFFKPRVRVNSYEELNAWLLDQCIAYAKAHRHPELEDRTI